MIITERSSANCCRFIQTLAVHHGPYVKRVLIVLALAIVSGCVITPGVVQTGKNTYIVSE